MLPICRDPAAPMPDPLPDFLYPAAEIPREGLYLWQDSDGLALCKAGEKGRVRVDFAAGAAQYRQHKGGGELIAKAVNHTAKPLVWDATGGLGRDAFVLAGLGLQVRVFERHPSVALLLTDGLARAQNLPETPNCWRQGKVPPMWFISIPCIPSGARARRLKKKWRIFTSWSAAPRPPTMPRCLTAPAAPPASAWW